MSKEIFGSWWVIKKEVDGMVRAMAKFVSDSEVDPVRGMDGWIPVECFDTWEEANELVKELEGEQ